MKVAWRLVIEGDKATVTTNAFRTTSADTFPLPIIPIRAIQFPFHDQGGRNDIAFLQVRSDGSLDNDKLDFIPRSKFLVDEESASIYPRISEDHIPQAYRTQVAEIGPDSCLDLTSILDFRYHPWSRLGVLNTKYATTYSRPDRKTFQRPYRTVSMHFSWSNVLCSEIIYDDEDFPLLARLANLDNEGGYLAKGPWDHFYPGWITEGPGHTIVAAVNLQREGSDRNVILCADQLIEAQSTLDLEDGAHYYSLVGNKLLIIVPPKRSAFLYELTSTCDAKKIASFIDPRYWVVSGAVSGDGSKVALGQQLPNRSETLVTVLDARLKVLDRIETDQNYDISFAGQFLVIGLKRPSEAPGILFSTKKIEIYRLSN